MQQMANLKQQMEVMANTLAALNLNNTHAQNNESEVEVPWNQNRNNWQWDHRIKIDVCEFERKLQPE